VLPIKDVEERRFQEKLKKEENLDHCKNVAKTNVVGQSEW
jgi:hypothetical protein